MFKTSYLLACRDTVFCYALIFMLFLSCAEEKSRMYNIVVLDERLSIELIAQDPDIMTPIGMAIDKEDNIYILESHTHSAKQDYPGPKYDRIKRSIDTNNDGIPEDWTVYADSIEDGMNLAYDHKKGLLLTTKNSLLQYQDTNTDGIADTKQTLLKMVRPDDVYDHAGILGVAIEPNGWIYVSRGNTGGSYWRIEGSDASFLEGYGDGGNVMRCKVDGSQIEEVATGFWNPFDLKFDNTGRLFATDNDPDSRGPNRLVEIVPGGDYGYKSLYGGSGIHPFQSWNGELPGTLSYAAPLGEAPCALIDATSTNFGNEYNSQLLANIWEENNIVRIPLQREGSTVKGEPEVLVQGDSLFHPVALATNSKGDLYITDWVMRQYPNHGKGKVWRIKSNTPSLSADAADYEPINRFKKEKRNIAQLMSVLGTEDVFEQAIARRSLAKKAGASDLIPLLRDEDPRLRLQTLLTFFKKDDILPMAQIDRLLLDENLEVQKMTLIYIGRKGISAAQEKLIEMLRENRITPELFETYLATLRHLQPEFIEALQAKSGKSGKIARELPDGFIKNILQDSSISETVKAMALPYLPSFELNIELIVSLLGMAREEIFQLALIRAAKETGSRKTSGIFEQIFSNTANSDAVRGMALFELITFPKEYFAEVLAMLKSNSRLLQYAAIKYLCLSPNEKNLREAKVWIENNSDALSPVSLSVWNAYNGKQSDSLTVKKKYAEVQDNGDVEIGRLVYENRTSLCTSCHKIDGWGGIFGPELSRIASSKSKTQLVNAILEPSTEISPEWQGWFLVDKEGVRHTGRQIDIHENDIELMNVNGDYDTFMHPKAYGVMEKSVMPEGLHKTMTVLEFHHLISYLSTLK